MKRYTFFSILSVAVLAACGSSSGSGNGGGGNTGTGTGGTTTGTGGTTGTTTSSGTGTSTHMNQCVQTTDTGNANGVGAYCTPGGGECSSHPNASLCLADIGQDEWFCTKIGCQMDSDCGDGATCVMQTGGSACVPNKCLQGGTGGAAPDGGSN